MSTIKKIIELYVETKDAILATEKLKEEVKDVGIEAEKSSEKTTKSVKGVEKSSKAAGLGVKGIGMALKAIGIGIILGLFASFVNVLTENRKVADFLSTALGTLGNFFSQVVNALVKTIEAAYEARSVFDNFKKTLQGLKTLALTPLNLALLATKAALLEAQLAWEESFLGDNDPATIKDLNKRLTETMFAIRETTKEALKAGLSVKNNVVEAVGKIGEVVGVGISEISNLNLSAAYAQAKATTNLKNSAALAEASLQGLVEKYDRLAESQRAIRDDESKSIAERIKANKELGRLINEQERTQIALANTKLQLAKQEALNNADNIEVQKAIIEAQTEIAAIQAAATGFRTEQITSENSLLKEQKEILKELNKIGKEDLELAKLEAAEQLAERERVINLQVQDEQEKFMLLITARNDYNKAIQKLDDAETERVRKINEGLEMAALEKLKNDFDNEALSFAQRLEIIKSREQLLLESTSLTEEQRTKIEQENADARNDIARKESAAKIATTQKTADVLGSLAQLAGEQTAAGKGLAVASSTINTFRGVSDALAATTVTPFETALKFANAAAIGIAGLKNVNDIIKVKIPGVAAGSGGGSIPSSTAAAGGPQAPAFNLTGSSGINQLSGSVQGAQPLRAFVVGSDVTNQQAMDRATFRQAGI